MTQMLAAARDGGVAACDLLAALEMSRAIASKLAAFQARAAAVLAARESHGDGGTGVLRRATGMSRRQAEGQARAVRVLDDLPALRDVLEAGRVSFNNAARLAEAVEATSADAVQADAELLAKAESMADDQFSREARRWAARQQPDDGEAGYARCRVRRSLRISDGDDGMVHMRGEFDPVTGERIRNRLEAEARRVRQADARDERRSFAQAMADALDGLTTVGSNVVQGRGRGGQGLGGRERDGQGRDGQGQGQGGRGRGGQGQDGGRAGPDRGDGGAVADSVHRGRPIADIAVVSYVDSETGDLVSQLATGEPLPPSVLEMLACNASITGILYDTAGTPLWRGTTKRTATASQIKALIARDGGCVGCGCHPALCQAHHIKPAFQGGPTTIANMVLLCWDCHHKVHHHQWTVARRHGRFELLPPVRTRWGPARAPDPPGPGPSALPSTLSSALPAEPLFAAT